VRTYCASHRRLGAFAGIPAAGVTLVATGVFRIGRARGTALTLYAQEPAPPVSARADEFALFNAVASFRRVAFRAALSRTSISTIRPFARAPSLKLHALSAFAPTAFEVISAAE